MKRKAVRTATKTPRDTTPSAATDRKAVRTATKTPRDTTPSAATISSTKKRKAVRTATKAVRSDTKTPRSTTGEKLPSGARSKRPNVLPREPLSMFHAGKVYKTISKF